MNIFNTGVFLTTIVVTLCKKSIGAHGPGGQEC